MSRSYVGPWAEGLAYSPPMPPAERNCYSTEDTPKQAPLNPESSEFMFQVGASQGSEEQRKHDV